MYKFLILFVLIFSISVHAKEEYTPFIQQQMSFIEQMNENNITKDKIKEILSLQKSSYEEAVDSIMRNKQEAIKKINNHESEIFALKKIIKINKRAGNTYAVLRDEVQIQSFRLLAHQNFMIKDILNSLDYASFDEFKKELNENIIQNQLKNESILNKDYTTTLELEIDSKTLRQAKVNIKELNALIEINQDMINHVYIFAGKMYRLNKYSKYHLIGAVLYINSMDIVKLLNPILENYGLNIIKLLAITFLILSIYFVRKFVYVTVEGFILNVAALKKYSRNILDAVRRPIDILIIILNLNMVVYIYNDYSSVEEIAKLFNITYGILFTIILYKVLNAVAEIKIHEIDSQNKQIKNEVINVGIKIVNFIIMVTGLLIVLHFAGANLTAVLSGLGIGGFAVALAAKDSLANFFGTLSILLSDVFSQGDWIVIDGKEGVVVEIGLRVTTLRTFDNALIAIPNAILANQDVKNWTKRELGRRIKMSLGIKYDSKSQDIKNAVNEIRTMLDKHPKIATENTKYEYNSIRAAKLVSQDDAHGVKKLLLVYLDEFSDSSINILVYCFTKSTDWDEWLTTKEDVMHQIMGIFEKNNLEFAFPSMSLYHESHTPKVADIN